MSRKLLLIAVLSILALIVLVTILFAEAASVSAKPIDPPYPGTAVHLTATAIKANSYPPFSRPAPTATPCPVKVRCDYARRSPTPAK